jgi:ribosomal protein L23
MPTARLIQTEKAYNLQQAQTFVITFSDHYEPNKIELAKILRQNGLSPLQINLVSLPNKTKRKGTKRRTYTSKRPTKYYIKLKIGETLDEEKLNQIFPSTENTQA